MSTPPTIPAPFDPSNPDLFIDRPRWPTPVGIVSICWASLGLLCGILFTVGFAFTNGPQFSEMVEKGMGSPMPDVLRPNSSQLVLMAIGTLWAGVLLFAGIATLTRKESGRTLHLLYAIVALALAVVGLYLQARQMGEVRTWVDANPDNPWAKGQNPIGQFLGACFGMIFSLAYPIFLLIWFGVAKRNQKLS